jgi:DNA-binding transcriptional regulator YiaG
MKGDIMDTKIDTFLYEDLGFPIMLVNAPLRKVYGEWVLDINLGDFIDEIVRMLIHTRTPLNGDELRFMRKYFELTTTEFGKIFGVTHVAVLKWEANENQIPPTTEKCIRMHALERLNGKDEELLQLYREIDLVDLAKKRKSKATHRPFRFNLKNRKSFMRRSLHKTKGLVSA